MSELLILNPAEIIEHPLLKLLPPLDPASAEVADFCSLVGDTGEIFCPVLVDETGRLLDGRRRVFAARMHNLQVPGRMVPEGSAIAVLLAALSANGRYTKSAMAYLAYPHLEKAIDEARNRQLENLKIGSRASGTRRSGATVDSLALSLGVTRELLFYAKDVHKLFAADPDAKARFEPEILSGQLGLENVVKAVKGRELTAGKTRPGTKWAQFIRAGFTSAAKGFKGWDKLPEGEQTALNKEISDQARTLWPEETRKQVRRALDQAEKN